MFVFIVVEQPSYLNPAPYYIHRHIFLNDLRAALGGRRGRKEEEIGVWVVGWQTARWNIYPFD